MDFHGMKRKHLQRICKKHGIRANMKNIEMATRLASLFQKGEEYSATDIKEDGIDRNGENMIVELHCESDTCTIPNAHGTENSGGNKAMDHFEESALFSGMEERHGLFGHSPHVTSVNLFDSGIDGTETTMEAERNVPLHSPPLTLPVEGEVGGTRFMVSEDSALSTYIQKQVNDALKELAVTDNKETDELIAPKVRKNVNSSGGSSSVSGKSNTNLSPVKLSNAFSALDLLEETDDYSC